MSIYGLNFNGTSIPEGMSKKFSKRIKFSGAKRGENARLQGVATSKDESEVMRIQANNGHRVIVVQERKTAAGSWFGVYVF